MHAFCGGQFIIISLAILIMCATQWSPDQGQPPLPQSCNSSLASSGPFSQANPIGRWMMTPVKVWSTKKMTWHEHVDLMMDAFPANHRSAKYILRRWWYQSSERGKSKHSFVILSACCGGGGCASYNEWISGCGHLSGGQWSLHSDKAMCQNADDFFSGPIS